MSAGGTKCAELGSRLLDQVGQRVAPEFASGAETLFADRAIPVRTFGAEAAPAEHEALISNLGTLVCRQQSGRNLFYVAATVAPWTGWSMDLLHENPFTREPKSQVYAYRSCATCCSPAIRATFSGNFAAAWRTAATIALALMLHLKVGRMRWWGVYTFCDRKGCADDHRKSGDAQKQKMLRGVHRSIIVVVRGGL